MHKPKFSEIGFTLGSFSPVFTSQKAINGHFRGMSLGLEEADARYKKVGCDHHILKEGKELEAGIEENRQRLKIAEYIFDNWFAKWKVFSTTPGDDPMHEAKVSKIDWENLVFNYCPTKRNKDACTEEGLRPFKPEKMSFNMFFDGYFTSYIYIHTLQVNKDEDYQVVSIIDKAPKNK